MSNQDLFGSSGVSDEPESGVKSDGEESPAIWFVHGSDDRLVSEAMDQARIELVGERPVELVMSEFEGEQAISEMLDAAWTPAFLPGQRVLVARLGPIGARDASMLAAYLSNPSPDSILLVSASGRLSRELARAIEAAGELRAVSAPAPHKRAEWVAQRARDAGMSLTGDASRYIAESLGESVTALSPLLAQVRVAFPEDERIGVDQVASILSGPRKGASWDLTDAIDRGSVDEALGYLAGALAEDSHPLQVVALLHGHFRRLARAAGRNEGVAVIADELGIKQYPAEKAIAQASRLGDRGIRRAISLLARADLDLKGASAMPPDLVLDILVIKLCELRSTRATGQPV